ncbi:hypothetical protein A6J80_17415 [Paracoccus yeei]|uniref:Collagen-like protein n=1 Tax=Paracoccus yeei TaxID=147645 RepID=A0A1V0GVQ1_9RHOB|nr:hypothetical protein [Paracoccus yeei]ARC37892.1 hypothetical protein A6J80_17415 [Paracoccus yeei]
MIDPQKFGSELADIVKFATAPLLARIEALEGQLKAACDRPVGPSPEALVAQLDAVEARAKAHADEAMQKAMAAIPASVEPPAPPEVPDIPALVAEAVQEAVKALPAPQDGKDGASVTPEDVMPALEKRVDDFLATIPAPKDGRDGVDGIDGTPGDKGEPGRDGLDVKDLFRADGGRLIAVMSDGTTKDLGAFVGKDGEPGRDGVDGRDGADGLGFEDMDFVTDDHGRVLAKFTRGDVVKSVRLPGIVDRGPYKAGEEYEKGDAVSYGGSLWIAQEPTGDKPDGSKAWRLSVKKGRDARGS